MLTSPPLFTLLCLLAMVQAEVVPNFQPCLAYFYKDHVPVLDAGVIRRSTHICQRYNNRYHFATLYDTQRRIPVYSAYIFQPGDGKGRPRRWFVEPQLGDITWDPEMIYESTCPVKYALLGMNQALDEDYKFNPDGLHRGHLNPYSHNIGDSAKASCTLTNAVPQDSGLNSGEWRVYEENLHALFKKKCSRAYVVVGAIPSKNNAMNNRVNIPDYLWNAYCCLDNNRRPIESGAAFVENINGARVRRLSLNRLNHYVRYIVGNIFDNNCT